MRLKERWDACNRRIANTKISYSKACVRENSQGEDNGAGSLLITMVKEALYIEMTLVEELVLIKTLVGGPQ